jgi:pSer/pThr/pTyr-binding forkhead associated (FHA) protein
MALKIYVAQDSKGREWPPDTQHEVGPCEWMVQKAWEEFHHLQELYAILLNVRHPSADMIVIRELGLGVLEMKDYFNEIHIEWKDAWTAGGSHAIQAGIHLNPREQVRSYARSLREKIIHDLLPADMQTGKNHWNSLKFQTAVCFTNPRAGLQNARKYVEARPPELEPWEEKFSILALDDFTDWVHRLRFELKKDPPKNPEPIRLSPEKIEFIATQLLDQVEWEEIYPSMPTGHPYGYLVLEDTKGRQVFNLLRDRSIVGRSHECDVVIPERFSRVSKRHCLIQRNLDGVIVRDYPSRNGTFKDDKRLEKTTSLQHGDVLVLGGSSSKMEPCTLRFELHGRETYRTKVTESRTRRMDQNTG